MIGAAKLLFTFLILITPVIMTRERNVEHPDMHYILLWTENLTQPYKTMSKGQNIFVERKCKYRNCFVTNDELYLKNVTDFDAVVFIGSEISKSTIVPSKRSEDQLYVFASKKSAKDYPMDTDFDWFFNMTWTYKLDSDIPSWYIAVRNNTGAIVGPKKEPHWLSWTSLDKMVSLVGNNYLTQKLHDKKTAVMWMADNCNVKEITGSREEYAKELENQMQKYGLKFDTYGKCGKKNCTSLKECLTKLESHYYFYFAAEDAISEDYVTENLLYPLQHFAVPIVYGGANYTRFMPEGSYLNAKTLPADELALQIYEILNDKDKYLTYFRWQKYYTFENTEDSPDTNEYCKFCAILNNKRRRSERKVYAHFSQWWNEHPYETDGIFHSLHPAPVVTFSPVKTTDKIIMDNPYIPTSHYVEKKKEAGFFGFIAKLFNYYFDIAL